MNNKIKVISRFHGFLSCSLINGKFFRWPRYESVLYLTKEELKELYDMPGAKQIFEKLFIDDVKVVKEIIGTVEPEYFYTEDKIVFLLTEGTIEQLEDTLNFGPEGIKDLVMNKAIELKISDLNKRNLIKEKTGKDITNCIDITSELPSEVIIQSATNSRKTAPLIEIPGEDDEPSRRMPKV